MPKNKGATLLCVICSRARPAPSLYSFFAGKGGKKRKRGKGDNMQKRELITKDGPEQGLPVTH